MIEYQANPTRCCTCSFDRRRPTLGQSLQEDINVAFGGADRARYRDVSMRIVVVVRAIAREPYPCDFLNAVASDDAGAAATSREQHRSEHGGAIAPRIDSEAFQCVTSERVSGISQWKKAHAARLDSL